MKTFRQYLAESTKEHVYVLKLAMEPTSKQVDTIESYLKKFDLLSLGKPDHAEKDKIDFYDIPNRSVWQMRVATAMPISPYVVMQGLKDALNIPEDYIVMRGSNEPVEVYAEDEEFRGLAYDQDDIGGKQSASLLTTDRFYDDAEQPLLTDMFGDDYNKKLLDYLRKVEDDRKPMDYEAPAPLFSWIDMHKVNADQRVEPDDFNAHLDTPKPVYKAGSDKAPIDTKFLGNPGNFDDAATANVRLSKDAKGKRSAVSAPRSRLKAEKAR